MTFFVVLPFTHVIVVDVTDGLVDGLGVTVALTEALGFGVGEASVVLEGVDEVLACGVGVGVGVGEAPLLPFPPDPLLPAGVPTLITI